MRVAQTQIHEEPFARVVAQGSNLHGSFQLKLAAATFAPLTQDPQS